MHNYAQINSDGIVVGISQLSGPVEADNLIPIDEMDHNLLGKRWTGSAWETVPEPEPAGVEPTELDRINEKLDTHSQLLFQLGMASIAPPAPEEITTEPPAIPDTPDPSSLPPVPEDMSLDPDLLLGLMEGAPTPPPELP